MKVNYTSFKVYLNHIYPNTKHPSVRPTIHPSIQFLCFLYFNLSIFKTDSFRPTQPSLKHNTHLSDHSPTGPPIHQCIIRTSFIHCRCSQNHIPTNPSVHFLQDTKYRCSETLWLLYLLAVDKAPSTAVLKYLACCVYLQDTAPSTVVLKCRACCVYLQDTAPSTAVLKCLACCVYLQDTAPSTAVLKCFVAFTCRRYGTKHCSSEMSCLLRLLAGYVAKHHDSETSGLKRLLGGDAAPSTAVLKCLACVYLQEIRHQVRRLFSGYLAEWPGAQGSGQSVPPQLLHVHGMSQAAEHWRGTLCAGWQQVYLQGGLHLRQDAPR
jgi:hypothetical protein